MSQGDQLKAASELDTFVAIFQPDNGIIWLVILSTIRHLFLLMLQRRVFTMRQLDVERIFCSFKQFALMMVDFA